MTFEEAKKLKSGVYKIWWATGGSTSVAAVGRDKDRNVWLHPANWITATGRSDYWVNVRKVELIQESKI